jgi:hypothetical protein
MIDPQDAAVLGFAGLCKRERGEGEGDTSQGTELAGHQKSSRDAAPLRLYADAVIDWLSR